MDKKNKGLADNHDGDFILNESGTSVSMGDAEQENTLNESKEEKENNSNEDKPNITPGT